MEAEETSFLDQGDFPHLELMANVIEASRKSNLTLVGRIIMEKVIKHATVQLITRRIWFTKEPAKVEQLCHSSFLFSFKNERDRARVWNQ